MATINRLAIFFLFLTSLVSSEALFAEDIRQSLNHRDSNYGGWALSSPSCPAGTTSCKSGDNASSCCPNEYECQYDDATYQHFCCTTGTNCQTTIQNIPICANTSWSMYGTTFESGYFCCLAGQVGVLNSNGIGFGSCGDATLGYSSSQLASSVAEPTIPATTSGSSPATTSSSSLATTTPSSPLSAVSSSTKLRTDAVVGIAVGGVVLITIMGVIVRMFFRYRQRLLDVPRTRYRPQRVELGDGRYMS